MEELSDYERAIGINNTMTETEKAELREHYEDYSTDGEGWENVEDEDDDEEF